MAAHAGERAEKTGVFHCVHCGETVHVNEGDKIPECPNGHKTYMRAAPVSPTPRAGQGLAGHAGSAPLRVRAWIV